MKIVNASYKIETQLDGEKILQDIERWGRVCYKSEGKTDTYKFVKNLIKSGHESVLEHHSFTVRIICDRAIANEIVRHRIASYSQESTRYCNYDKLGIEFIEPVFWKEGECAKYLVWKEVMEFCESRYIQLIRMGATPEQARTVLPHSLKTEIVMTMNLREWRHFFKLRTPHSAHPQMREIMIPLLEELQMLHIPVVFDDIEV